MSLLNRKTGGWGQALAIVAAQVPQLSTPMSESASASTDTFAQQILLQGLRACAIGGQVEPASALYDMWKKRVNSSQDSDVFSQQNELAKSYFFRAMTKPLTSTAKSSLKSSESKK